MPKSRNMVIQGAAPFLTWLCQALRRGRSCKMHCAAPRGCACSRLRLLEERQCQCQQPLPTPRALVPLPQHTARGICSYTEERCPCWKPLNWYNPTEQTPGRWENWELFFQLLSSANPKFASDLPGTNTLTMNTASLLSLSPYHWVRKQSQKEKVKLVSLASIKKKKKEHKNK